MPENNKPGAGTPPNHRPKSVRPKPGEKPAILSYVKPEMELYVAADKYVPPPKKRGNIAKTQCTCNLVCTCEKVAGCGCNLVKVRRPGNLTLHCTCDRVAVCTCNTVLTCTCDRVSRTACSCDLVCTCDPVCTCQTVCNCVRVCRCVSVCGCERFRSGGGSRSVCTCVPVIH